MLCLSLMGGGPIVCADDGEGRGVTGGSTGASVGG